MPRTASRTCYVRLSALQRRGVPWVTRRRAGSPLSVRGLAGKPCESTGFRSVFRLDTIVRAVFQSRAMRATRALLVPALAGVFVSAPAVALTGAGTVTITRDPFGIPHVVGDTREAMAFGAGYALATDRLFETDVIRRLAQGRLSEILGAGDNDATLIADETMRREFYDAADIDAQYNALPDDIRRMLQALADGFNAALAAQQAGPAEQSVLFAALGYEPDLWRPQDSASVLMLFT